MIKLHVSLNPVLVVLVTQSQSIQGKKNEEEEKTAICNIHRGIQDPHNIELQNCRSYFRAIYFKLLSATPLLS
jgi:hypothetical protein